LRKPQDEPATTPARPKISASMALNSADGGVGGRQRRIYAY
jgi:hypothetical protein